MQIIYDPNKNLINVKKRGLSFDRVKDVDFNDALIKVDDRKNYPEVRYIAACYLDQRLHILVFTETESGIRVISFRRANSREAKKYEKPLTFD